MKSQLGGQICGRGVGFGGSPEKNKITRAFRSSLPISKFPTIKMKPRFIALILTILLAAATAQAAPVDHVYVSNEKVDKLNLDGSLDMNFLGSGYTICRALAIDGNNGNVWVGCEAENSVMLYTSDGTLLNSAGAVITTGRACVDPYGNAWFTDRPGGKVRKFNSVGNYVNGYNAGGSNPSDIACDRFGNIWTANSSSGNVSKIGNNGNLLGTYLVSSGPDTIAVDQFDNLWTGGGTCVTKIKNDGTILNCYPLSNSSSGIAIDNNGNVWLSRGASNIVTKLSQTGINLGNFTILSPKDIAIDASGNIWTVQRTLSTATKLSNDGSNLGTFPLSGNSGQNDTGFRYHRFVLGYDSVEGPNVWVPINGGAPAGAVTLNFDYITIKGNSSYTESGTGTPPPGGWKLGTPPRYFDITTTATYTGDIEVCIGYNESEFSRDDKLRLYHNEGGWVNVTTSLDSVNNIVCGTVTGLSEFAIMEENGGGIPSVSEWGLILLAMLLLASLARRRIKTTD